MIRIVIFFYKFLAFSTNIYSSIKYTFNKKFIHTLTRRNSKLINLFSNEKVLLILNGPSANDLDIGNYNGFRIAVVNKYPLIKKFQFIEPDIYFTCDPHIIKQINNDDILLNKLKTYTRTIFITNYYKKNLIKLDNDNLYYSYSRLHPISSRKLTSKLTGLNFNFYNVSFYALNNLIALGFKEIYIAGYDFDLTFGHAYEENNQKEILMLNKYEHLNSYFNYFIAHFESYLLVEYAKSRNVKIINLNPFSKIRAFDFSD